MIATLRRKWAISISITGTGHLVPVAGHYGAIRKNRVISNAQMHVECLRSSSVSVHPAGNMGFARKIFRDRSNVLKIKG
ncbi:hypothetical protein BO1005MUT1_350109 [Hyphomicrobiales bacterium]|nr:hypothetical protein BO1005MUT1_350109 [Hyphomicrobiales bacterium]